MEGGKSHLLESMPERGCACFGVGRFYPVFWIWFS